MITVLIPCGKRKKKHRAAARELYNGKLFRAHRRWAEQHGERWFILSALHGLVRPDQELEPYDFRILDRSPASRRVWASQVVAALVAEGVDSDRLVILLGADYRRPLEPLMDDFELCVPLRSSYTTRFDELERLTVDDLRWQRGLRVS